MNAHDTARRRLLGVSAATLTLSVLGGAPLARAGTATKDAFHYQDQPKDGQRCADCVQFIAPEAGRHSGNCRIVVGEINANGWCMAFTAKTPD
ncbi:iron oxidase [Rugamonas sp. FT107W]|uniref:High-potential iron-sulfur protein n=1 Tax=Duganella vulcania TaxID=2692166 RepID=A0A845HI93_9BURK|nr:high-potential iron-sulfur protein [Duganella vulcania]MYN18500.1 iron oxidase [Duganella vulcania]